MKRDTVRSSIPKSAVSGSTMIGSIASSAAARAIIEVSPDSARAATPKVESCRIASSSESWSSSSSSTWGGSSTSSPPERWAKAGGAARSRDAQVTSRWSPLLPAITVAPSGRACRMTSLTLIMARLRSAGLLKPD
jgi:hypothetical protein